MPWAAGNTNAGGQLLDSYGQALVCCGVCAGTEMESAEGQLYPQIMCLCSTLQSAVGPSGVSGRW